MKVGTLLGRLSNGAEADRGTRAHAVAYKTIQRPPCSFNEWGRNRDPANDTVEAEVALCGAKPGRRSVGWNFDGDKSVTCPRCAERQTKYTA